MRVLHVLNYAWPFIDGYTVRSIGLITAQARHLGLEVAIATSPFRPLTPNRDEALTSEVWGPERQHAAAAVDQRLQRLEKPALGFYPLTGVAFAQGLRHLIDDLRPDLIHAHHPHYVAATALRLARRKGIPAVYEIRCFNGDYALGEGSWRGRLHGQRHNRLEYALALRAPAVVTISTGLAARLAEHGVGRERIHIVRNSVDTGLFNGARRGPRNRNRTTLTAGYATTFEEMENLDGAVRAATMAARACASRGQRFKLRLAGTGRDWQRISALVDELRARDVVELCGFVPYGAMPDFYASLDLFLVPRKAATVARDTPPLKPLEALASGLPILASNLPAMRELLGGREQVRFVEPTAGAIADGIAAFSREPWPGGADVGDREWRSEVRKYESVYERAMATTSRPRVRRVPDARTAETA